MAMKSRTEQPCTKQLSDLNVSGDLATLLLDFIQQQQLSEASLQCRLENYQASSRMSFPDWWHYLEQLQQAMSCKGHRLSVGLALGAAIQPAHLGVLGYLTLSCDSVGEALQRFALYQRLLHDGETANLSVEGGQVCIRWSLQFGKSTQLSDEVLIMGLINNLRRMTGNTELSPDRVDFIFEPVVEEAIYNEWLDCEVYFHQPQLALYFPVTFLQLPVTNSDPALNRLLEQQAQALMNVIPVAEHPLQQEGIDQRLQQAIVKAIQSGTPTQDAVASMLALSRRTLQRRLQQRGLEFRVLLQQTRWQLAKQYLAEQRLTLTEIALLLGYSEHSAFTRAFRDWSGMSPTQYRNVSRTGGSESPG